MSRILWRSSVRYALRHPWQFGLAVLGIALGVAVVVAVDLANASARHAFDLSTRAVLGEATHRITGGPGGLPDRLYARLRLEAGLRDAAPVVAARVALPDRPGRSLELLGVDPLAEAPFRAHFGARGAWRGEDVLGRLMSEPGTVVLAAQTAEALGIGPGDALALARGGRRFSARVAGLIEPADALVRLGLGDVLVADVATAQELLGRVGRLDHIDLIVPEGEGGEALLARVRALLPADARLESAGARAGAALQMTRAFRLNLTMLSLLALVVGVFLIYNTMTFAVVQRRGLIGTLRALGVTRREVLVTVLAEAALVGGLGTALGLGLGVALGHGLVGLVSQTINDLYFAVSVRGLAPAPLALVKGLVLGVAAALAAALGPAAEATRVPPRAALSRAFLEARARRLSPRAAILGLVALALAAALLLAPGGSLVVAFAALFAVVAGFALLAPALTVALVAVLQRLVRRRTRSLGALAVRGVSASLSRTAVAVAALMVALSASVGVGVMVDSFRGSVAAWLEVTLRADLYVRTAGFGGEDALDTDFIERVRALPEVVALSMGRQVTVASEHGPVALRAIRMAPQSYAGFRFVEGEAERAWAAFDGADAVIVSEPFAYRHGAGAGAALRLRTPAGARAFPVAGVFRDYGSEQGVVVLSDAAYARHWAAGGYSTLGVYAAPGADLDRLASAVLAAAPAAQALELRSNAAIRAASLDVFDRTFTITRVLRVLATLIAFVGVLSALMALQLERTREIAVLRAQGLTAGQVWGVVETQTGVMGLIAGLLALPLGLALAAILTWVINRRSFGWSLDLAVDPGILVQALALAVAAALLAGLYPALRMARTPPALALREE